MSIESTSHRRVDFAIFHPQLDEKIIVEIDGKQHNNHMEADRNRDEILENYGYTVIRIQASEIQEEYGTQLSKLESKLFAINNDSSEKVDTSITRFKNLFQSIKISHQIQLTILQAIQSNILGLEGSNQWHIVSDIDRLGIFISFSDERSTSLPTFHVQNIFLPFRVANSSFPTTPLIGGIINPNKNVLIFFIQYLFRKEEFWEGQFEGIVRALQGKDALLLLPTGAGKSLVYQLASLLLPGRTVVIDPIISLMDDLALVGIDRCIAITSQIIDIEDNIRAIQLFGQGEYLFTFIAPERFQTTDFRNSLRELTVHTPISLITVDEAHCVSERGHDFRTAYLNIGRTSRIYCKSNGNPPPLLAMTGTASRSVLKDVKRKLQIEDFDAIITPKMFDRKELKFHIINAASQEKPNILNGFLGHKIPKLFNITTSSVYQTKGGNSYSGLVFCQNVRGNFGVENVSRNISNQLGISTEIYSGREPKHWKSDQYLIHKKRVTNEFKRNRFPLLVCIKAFGMGIDKPNIRFTVHYGLPQSIESFYIVVLSCLMMILQEFSISTLNLLKALIKK